MSKVDIHGLIFTLIYFGVIASTGRARGRIYQQHIVEKNPAVEERKRIPGYELWTRRGVSHQWFVQKTDAGNVLILFYN